MRENCIVTLGIGKNYPRGVKRLIESIKKNKINSDYCGHLSYPQGIPSHEKIPYAFKYFLIDKLIKKGYKRVIWIDVSFIILNNLDFIWKHLDKHGYLVYSGTHSLGKYTSDKCLEAFNIPRDDSFKLKSVASGIFGIKNDSQLGKKILKDLCWYALNTQAYDNPKICSIDKRVKGHRPCQSVLSLVCYKYNALIWRSFYDEIYTLNKHTNEKYEENNEKYNNKNYILDRVYVKRNYK